MERFVLLPAFVIVLCSSLVWAQGPPPENHYKVYLLAHERQVYSDSTGPVGMNDQFNDPFAVDTLLLDKLATPVDKNGEGVPDDVAHQTWWLIDHPQPSRQVTLDNQFGQQEWTLGDGRYLVLPALKNQPGEPPVRNHYKCYEATGPAVDQPVALTDQFGSFTYTAREPVFFCNPADKQAGGQNYPIIEPEHHLACYRLDPANAYDISGFAIDQFGQWDFLLGQDCWLCVPSQKSGFIRTEESTWGQVKSIYAQ